jgi:hypothetical protein
MQAPAHACAGCVDRVWAGFVRLQERGELVVPVCQLGVEVLELGVRRERGCGEGFLGAGGDLAEADVFDED